MDGESYEAELLGVLEDKADDCGESFDVIR